MAERSAIYNPFDQIQIVTHTKVEYDGSSMLCCETRADVPEHKDAITDNFNNEGVGVFECYRSLAPQRRYLIRADEKNGVCAKCDTEAVGTMGRNQKLANILAGIPGLQKSLNRAYWNRLVRANRQ